MEALEFIEMDEDSLRGDNMVGGGAGLRCARNCESKAGSVSWKGLVPENS